MYQQPHPLPNGENFLLVKLEVRLLIGILQEITCIKLNLLLAKFNEEILTTVMRVFQIVEMVNIVLIHLP